MMILVNFVLAGVCLSGMIAEFALPEDKQSRSRLFLNTIFFGLNAYFAYIQF